MKKIELTKGQYALVDDEDFEWVSAQKWQAKWDETTQSFYAQGAETVYPNGVRKQISISMHRKIMQTPKGQQCDHINHDTLDNRKCNLRNVTSSQNSMNRKGVRSDNVLGVRGVSPHGNGFRAFIYIDRKRIYFRTHKNLQDALSDRKEAEMKYYGEFRGSNG